MRIDMQSVQEKFDVLISQLHHTRNTRGDVDGRGISIAITHVETARLWFEDSIKDEEDSATSEPSGASER